MSVSNKPVALITGANSGIGLAIGRRFLSEGRALALVIRGSKEDLKDLEPEVDDFARVLVVIAELTSEADVRRAIRQVAVHFGRLDVVVNNAGHFQESSPVSQLSRREWDRTLDVSLRAPFLVVKHALPLLAANRGAVVNVSSINSFVHVPWSSAYAAAKGGLDALTRQLAVECGPLGVRVNGVNPGLILTSTVADFLQQDPVAAAGYASAYPLGRGGTPDEVAAAVAFLASADASFITGTTVPVDGGISVQSPATAVVPHLRRGATEAGIG